ncbi:hypothetical protein [Streptomyces sp. TRM70350]|uniref:hypothetical protein n=1 Tax=Streptomyces sp. TRM70350 TaxID=2856165 RepID=UPI001C468B3C|nr:hypothetical protein [Streptomyces sp. TRM70350]MBV7698744.1 hypothetical protein [Streptomyces sp. TRM70350]
MLQYHGRSDRHSKLACWGILFDLLRSSSVLRSQVESREVVFGVNHTMKSYAPEKSKKLDLVLCRPEFGQAPSPKAHTLESLAEHYGVELTSEQERVLKELPTIYEAPVGNVLMAFEAKACMTEHVKALPRLYDELNSSHQIVHGHSSNALSIGVAMVNASETFHSPTNEGKVNTHSQPRVMQRTIDTVASLPRRSHHSDQGFDGLAIVVVDMENDGTPCELVTAPPAPQPDDVLHYDRMLQRVAHEFDSRFSRR